MLQCVYPTIHCPSDHSPHHYQQYHLHEELSRSRMFSSLSSTANHHHSNVKSSLHSRVVGMRPAMPMPLPGYHGVAPSSSSSSSLDSYSSSGPSPYHLSSLGPGATPNGTSCSSSSGTAAGIPPYLPPPPPALPPVTTSLHAAHPPLPPMHAHAHSPYYNMPPPPPATSNLGNIDPTMPRVADALSSMARHAEVQELEERMRKGSIRKERNRLAAKKSRSKKRDRLREAEDDLAQVRDDMLRLRDDFALKETEYKEKLVAAEAQNRVFISGDWTRHQLEKTTALQKELARMTEEQVQTQQELQTTRRFLEEHVFANASIMEILQAKGVPLPACFSKLSNGVRQGDAHNANVPRPCRLPSPDSSQS